jgi:hypothetical protein
MADASVGRFESYLSLHHSDDNVFKGEQSYALSPPLSPPLSTFDDDIASTVDSSTSPGLSFLGPSSLEWLPLNPYPK